MDNIPAPADGDKRRQLRDHRPDSTTAAPGILLSGVTPTLQDDPVMRTVRPSTLPGECRARRLKARTNCR
jgi:hypothetical protein